MAMFTKEINGITFGTSNEMSGFWYKPHGKKVMLKPKIEFWTFTMFEKFAVFYAKKHFGLEMQKGE